MERAGRRRRDHEGLGLCSQALGVHFSVDCGEEVGPERDRLQRGEKREPVGEDLGHREGSLAVFS